METTLDLSPLYTSARVFQLFHGPFLQGLALLNLHAVSHQNVETDNVLCLKCTNRCQSLKGRWIEQWKHCRHLITTFVEFKVLFLVLKSQLDTAPKKLCDHICFLSPPSIVKRVKRHDCLTVDIGYFLHVRLMGGSGYVFCLFFAAQFSCLSLT